MSPSCVCVCNHVNVVVKPLHPDYLPLFQACLLGSSVLVCKEHTSLEFGNAAQQCESLVLHSNKTQILMGLNRIEKVLVQWLVSCNGMKNTVAKWLCIE